MLPLAIGVDGRKEICNEEEFGKSETDEALVIGRAAFLPEYISVASHHTLVHGRTHVSHQQVAQGCVSMLTP